MAQVLCAVDGSPAAREAVDQAVASCRARGADLRLVGVVREGFFDTTRVSDRVRRYRAVQFGLVRAAEAARAAGLEPELAVRAGDAPTELLREADATGAEEIFLARGRSRARAALTGRPRIDVVHVKLDELARPAAEEALRKAA